MIGYELPANISQHGLPAHARNLVSKSPDFDPTLRANGFSGESRFVTKSAKAASLGLDFAPRIPSRKFICAAPSYLRTSSKPCLPTGKI